MKIQHKINTLTQSISLIALTSGLLCNSAFALQAMEDEHLENVTGEGIGLILDNVKVRFNGADDEAGTGYTRLIPVGALSSTIQTHNDATANASGTAAQKKRAAYDVDIGKADIYVYGLAISKNDNNANTQFSDNGVTVGTPTNPWLFQTKTDQIPNFAGVSKSLTYLGIEAPLFDNLLKTDGTLVTTDTNAYDLKLGLWADAFVRDPDIVEGEADEFALNGAGRLTTTGASCTIGAANCVPRENRLRLQAILNGVSLNGTNVKIFQTLDSANTAAGLGTAYNHYNNTFGMALTARINSGASTAFRGSTYNESIPTGGDNTVDNTGAVSGWSNLHGGWTTTLNTIQEASGEAALGADTSCNNTGSVTTTMNSGSSGCRYMLQSRTRTDTKTRTTTKNFTWGMASNLNNHVLRFSTRETDNTDVLSSPAISTTSIAMPTFQGASGNCNAKSTCNTEGLYLYKSNINLVLGTQWQPLVLTSDGNNFSLELTRIPNTANVYKEIYAVYPDATGGLTAAQQAEYKGGTCSIYWCGGDGNGYAKNATHSSITIGSTNYTAPVNTGTKTPLAITAYTGADSAGVSFGDLMMMNGLTLTNTGDNTSTPVTTTQVRWIERQVDTKTWRYRCENRALSGCDGLFSDTDNRTNMGFLNQWNYVGGNGIVNNITTQNAPSRWECNWDGWVCSIPINRYDYPIQNGNGYTWQHDQTTAGICPKGNDCEYYSTINNRNWTYDSRQGLNWSTATNGGVDAWLLNLGYAGRTSYNLDTLSNQATVPEPKVAQPWGAVNLGSAVIDGLLIQHFKITTKGL